MATTKDILIEAINSGYSTPEEVTAAKAALATLNAPPAPLAVAPAEPSTEPSTGPDMGDNLAGQFNRDEYFEEMRRAEPDNPEYTVEAEEGFELLHFSESVKAHLAAVAACDADFTNITAECRARAKTLFPNEDSRLDQTAHLVDRALSDNWPAAWGKCPTGQWNGAPFAVIAPVVTSVPAPTQDEKSTNLQIQQLLSDDHRLLEFVPSRYKPEAPPAELKSDIEELLENERAALDQQDAAASRRWNRAMNLSPAFQPGRFEGDD